MGDIESMYYRVKVPEEDSDFLRFLWWPDGDLTNEPQEYRMLVHLFGAVSSSSCATFALRQTETDLKESYDESTTSMLRDNFYVDDFLASVDEEDKAITLVEDVTSLCQERGFKLTKWISNSHTVMKTVPPED